MLKTWFLLVMIVLAATIAFAQNDTSKKSTATKKASTAASSGPTKVTGPGTKTASGLEYWDIKVGTGATANKSQTVKVHYTGWRRSEEHTSELQSQSNLVCRLL